MQTETNNKKVKITIIGAGPGGYEAAIMACKLGADVTLIEEDQLGGTCLNRGCIPTKVFLNTANKVKEVKDIHALNIKTNEPSISFNEVVERKNKNINKLKKGIDNLIKENKIHFIKGKAQLSQNHLIKVNTGDEVIEFPTDFTILATGSIPIIPETFNHNGFNIISTDELFDLKELPESIIIVGGGVAAIEISQYLARFGVKVTIVEAKSHILPDEDEEIVRKFGRVLKKDKIKILTKTKIVEVIPEENKVKLITESGKILEAQKVLICIGRTPNIKDLFNQNLNINTDDKGFIQVNNFLETNLPSVYAIGDLIHSPMLAHTAMHEGLTAVNNILKSKKPIDYRAVPNTIFTEPEIASVGLRESELKDKNISYLKGSFPFRLLGKSLTLNRQDGLVKILTDENKKILGATILGTHASDLIMELVLAVRLGLTTDEIMDTIHPHPSLSEAILEASRDVSNLSINKL